MDAVKRIVDRTWYDLTRPIFLKQMAWAIALWLFVMTNLIINIHILRTEYPNPPQPPDLLFDLIPENTSFIGIGEAISSIMVITVLFALWEQHFEGAPKLLFLLGVMFLMRGYVILLTPLGQVQPPSVNYDKSHIIAQTFYHGMFFSGHTASAFIQALYFKRHRLRPFMLFLATLQVMALVISHSHYSIDIFGGLFVAYFVTHFEWMRLVPRRLEHVSWLPWALPQDQAIDEAKIQVQMIPQASEQDIAPTTVEPYKEHDREPV